jgi:uncharacterized OB-fold protein
VNTVPAIQVVGCMACEYKAIPPKYTCPTCYQPLQNISVSGEGKIYSYTTIHVAPGALAAQAPYHVILVELDDGLKITARMHAETAPAIGLKVQFNRVDDSVYWFDMESS